jgi:CRP-like cAMP-binding protein
MQLDDTATILAHADFFEICNEEQCRLLAFASERRMFAPGTVISKHTEVPTGAYVLVSGTISSQPAGEGGGKPYQTSTQGAVVSTMALLIAKKRPVTITAITEVETIFVPRHAFMKLVQQFPDLADRAATRIKRELGAYLGALDRVRLRINKDE